MEEQTGMGREIDEGLIHTQLTSPYLSSMNGGTWRVTNRSLFRGNKKLGPRSFQPPPLTSVPGTHSS